MKADTNLLSRLADSKQEVSLDLTDLQGKIYAHVYKATIIHTVDGWLARWLPKDCDKPAVDGWAYKQRPSQYHSWLLISDIMGGCALYKNLTTLSGSITLGGL